MPLPIYLDYMATTPVDSEVINKMHQCLGVAGTFANPASTTHFYGLAAADLVQEARQQIADLIHADPREIIWTSGATEADNLAIKGIAYFYQRKGKHIVTMCTEHKAILDSCQFLESEGFEITYLKPETNGILNLTKLKNALRKDTLLVSVMHVNNETGVIQDIEAIGEICQSHGVLLHVDAAQSAGKIPINVKKMKIALMSFSAHKIYGPKGIGALYIRREPPIRLQAFIHGGGHEKGLRSGTLPVHQIVGMGEAFAIAKRDFEKNRAYMQKISQQFWQGLQVLKGIRLNGDLNHKLASCFNLSFDGVEGNSLLLRLTDIAISAGSACNSAHPDPSHVLLGMGLSRGAALNSLRISLGLLTTTEEIDFAVNHIVKQVNALRSMSPIWDRVSENLKLP